ncbi:MAG: hypothetical protein KAR20_06905, partial [Candidatus Heimdallarchaeota archaeon]|nr:hypothetical protein [Candidatus Heimdallarchaeota archaeon]
KIKRDLREDKSVLWMKDTHGFTEILNNKKKIEGFVDKHFGFSEWRVFANTLVIGQNDITILQPKNQSDKTTFAKLKQMIERATAGSKDADSSLSKIIKTVTDMHANLTSQNRRNAQIPLIRQEIDSVAEQLRDARSAEQNLAQNTAGKEKIEEELVSEAAKLKILENRKKLYDDKERILKAKQDIEASNHQTQLALEQIKTIRDERAQLDEKVKPLETKYQNITEDIERKIHGLSASCKEDYKRITEKNRDIEKARGTADREHEKINLYPGFDTLSEDEIHSVSTMIEMWKKTCTQLGDYPENNTSNSKNKYLITAIFLMAGIIGGMVLGNIVAGVIIGVVLVGIAYVLSGTKNHDDGGKERLVREKDEYVGEFSRIKVKIPSFDPNTFQEVSKNYIALVRSIDSLKNRIKDIEADIENENATLKSHKDELNTITNLLPEFSYEDFKKDFLQLKNIRSGIEAKNESLDTLLAGSSEEEMNKKHMENTSLLLKLDQEWEEKSLDYINFSDEEINDISHIAVLKKDVDEKGKKSAELSGRINESSGAGKNAIALEETLESFLEEKEKLVYKASVFELLGNYLKETDDEIKERFAPQVAEKMEPWLSRVTNNKYVAMSLNSNLELAVKIPETDYFVDIDVLSRGTQDQVYLGLRLVIGDLISGEKNVPAFLDDTMHTFDAMRLASAKTVFDEMAQERQVFVFSHNEAYTHWVDGGKLIEL